MADVLERFGKVNKNKVYLFSLPNQFLLNSRIVRVVLIILCKSKTLSTVN